MEEVFLYYLRMLASKGSGGGKVSRHTMFWCMMGLHTWCFYACGREDSEGFKGCGCHCHVDWNGGSL
jgi:hypothetical protein